MQGKTTTVRTPVQELLGCRLRIVLCKSVHMNARCHLGFSQKKAPSSSSCAHVLALSFCFLFSFQRWPLVMGEDIWPVGPIA